MEDDLEQDAVGFSVDRKQSSSHLIQEGPVPYTSRYNMNHSKRGLAIIFNHMHFSIPFLNTRHGTNKDKEDLTVLFEKLKFNVKCYDDLTKDGIKNVLFSAASEDHTDEDCIVIIVLSHGDNRKVFARDIYYPTDMLWKYFDGNHSPTLVGKPKLFFIQACRGEHIDSGVRLESRGHTEVDSLPNSENKYYSIPVMADILVMYSTTEDFLSWRNPISGSYFIQSLIRQLSAHAKEKDLLSILTYVNREVAVGYSSEMEKIGMIKYAHKQMSSIVSMLTREIYL